MKLHIAGALATVTVAVIAGCGGGTAQPPPMPVQAPSATPQLVEIAIPTGAIGVETDPTFGMVSGFTQQVYSQVLGFVPGARIMVRNADPDDQIPHTFSTVSTTGFVQNPNLSTTPTGGSTVAAGFSSGTIAPGAIAGPFTLAAGTYYLGCAYHYVINGMRTVLVVAANATPGPQATPNPQNTPEALPSGLFNY